MRSQPGFIPAPTATDVSDAAELVRQHYQAAGYDFRDDYFLEAAGHYGSARVKDRTTPANNVSIMPRGHVQALSQSPKLVMGPAATLWYPPNNLIPNSENIGGPSWTVINLDVSSGHLAPDGTMAAQLVIKQANSGNHRLVALAMEILNGLYAYGILRCKYAGHRYIGVEIPQGSGVSIIDTLNGTHVSGGLTPGIIDLGDGWFEYYFEGVNGSAAGDYYVRLHGVGDVIGGESEPGDGVSGVYLWRAQLGRAPADTTYLKTTDSPVFGLPFEWPELPHDGKPAGLRIEPEDATNFFHWSNDLSQGGINGQWFRRDVTATKTATGPDGVENSASELTADDDGGYAVNIAFEQDNVERVTSAYVKRVSGSGAVYWNDGSTTGPEIDPGLANWVLSGSTVGTWTDNGDGSWTFTDTVGGQNRPGVTWANNLITPGTLYRFAVEIVSSSRGVRAHLATGGPVKFIGSTGFHEIFGSPTGQGRADLAIETSNSNIGDSFTVRNVSVRELSLTELAITSEWQRLNFDPRVTRNPSLLFRLATAGDKIGVAYCQTELGDKVTSPILTQSQPVTRSGDVIGPALTAIPWNGGNGNLEVDGEPETPSDNGTVLLLRPRDGEQHVRTVKWVPA